MTLTPIQRAARGEACTFQIVGVCNNDPTTTVLCHLGSGTAKRRNDLNAAFGCSACHAAEHQQPRSEELEARREFYLRRAMVATHERLREMGILIVKGET